MKRAAASPIVCVASWKPAAAKRSITAAIRCGSGQNGVVPSPRESGASSHAVPASITPSAKNFAVPPVHSRPRSSRTISRVSSSASIMSGVSHCGTRRRMRQLAGLLEVAQQVVRGGLAVHHVRAGQPERVQPPQLRDVALAQLRPAQPRRGAQHEVLRGGLAQLARRHALDADHLRAVGERVRAGDVGELERARRRERGVQVREPHERGGAAHGGADLRAPSAPRRSPAPRRTASRAAASPRRAPRALPPCCAGRRGRRRGPARRPRTGAGASPPGPGRACCRARR